MKHQKWSKRDPVKNYFPVPNEVFLLGLSPGELAVYSYLLFCEDRNTYQCWPSFKTIGKATGMSTNTVRKYVRMLEDRDSSPQSQPVSPQELVKSEMEIYSLPSARSRKRWSNSTSSRWRKYLWMYRGRKHQVRKSGRNALRDRLCGLCEAFLVEVEKQYPNPQQHRVGRF